MTVTARLPPANTYPPPSLHSPVTVGRSCPASLPSPSLCRIASHASHTPQQTARSPSLTDRQPGAPIHLPPCLPLTLFTQKILFQVSG